jgi:ferredoxin-NADP reductase
LKKYISANDKHFYLCTPPPMMDAVVKQLAALHIDERSIVQDGF